MRVDELRLLALRRGVCAAQERKRARRVAEHLRKAFVSVREHLHGRFDLGVRKREAVLHPDDVLADYAELGELPLERGDVDVAEARVLLHARRGGEPGGVALVLDVGLHPEDRHRVAVRAHAKARDEESVGLLRQQRAERDVHLERLLRVRRLDEELVGDGLSVRVEVGARERDDVGVGALVHDVLRRHVVDSVQAAALAAVDVLALVPDIRAKVLARAEREVAEILRISVVDERVVRVLVARAEDLGRGARALER